MLASLAGLSTASLAFQGGTEHVAPARTTRGERLSESPAIWLTDNVVGADAVERLVETLPTDEARWRPCIGQVAEFASKRCTLVGVAGDAVLESAVASLERHYSIDASALRAEGLPIIRYLPGAPAVGVHGDVGATGLVPNMTLVLYLTDGGEGVGGQTFFPDAGVAVAPRRGAVLSFMNVDTATGAPDPAARHGVSAVKAEARGDRLVVQIPVLHRAGAARGVAYAEHVSGAKHKVHMGLMGAGACGYGIYALWQHDRTWGMAAMSAVCLFGLAALFSWLVLREMVDDDAGEEGGAVVARAGCCPVEDEGVGGVGEGEVDVHVGGEGEGRELMPRDGRRGRTKSDEV